jgi:hypothetical protein
MLSISTRGPQKISSLRWCLEQSTQKSFHRGFYDYLLFSSNIKPSRPCFCFCLAFGLAKMVEKPQFFLLLILFPDILHLMNNIKFNLPQHCNEFHFQCLCSIVLLITCIFWSQFCNSLNLDPWYQTNCSIFLPLSIIFWNLIWVRPSDQRLKQTNLTHTRPRGKTHPRGRPKSAILLP